MVMRFFRGPEHAGLGQVQDQLLQMLDHDRAAFDAATSALLSGGDPAVVGPALRATDAEVNELEREIRRELVVHASVHGAGDIAATLEQTTLVTEPVDESTGAEDQPRLIPRHAGQCGGEVL